MLLPPPRHFCHVISHAAPRYATPLILLKAFGA